MLPSKSGRTAWRSTFIGLSISALILVGCGTSAQAQITSTPTVIAATATRSVPTPTSRPMVSPTPTADPLIALHAALMPRALLIAKIGVNAPIDSLGPDTKGAMLAPTDKPADDPIWSAAYWWNPGFYPGEQGNAVIAGHVNRPDYSASIFTNLDKLVIGDAFIIQTVNGTQLRFIVREKRLVTAYASGSGDPIIGDLFGPSPTSLVNLVTCAGQWDGKTFNQRLVVRGELDGVSPFPSK